MNLTLKSLLGVALSLSIAFFALNAQATTCNSLNDFYSDEGCIFKGSASYSNTGLSKDLKVKIYKNYSGARNPRKIFHVVGPFEIPGLYDFDISDFSMQLNAILGEGVDVAYYSFAELNSDLVQNKAYYLIQALKKIDSLRGETTGSMMMGLSMGGVVARYALAKMESDGYKHGVKYFISYDSPHRGAHISRSIQYIPLFIDRALDRIEDDNDGSMSFFGPILRFVEFIDIWNLISIEGQRAGDVIPSAQRLMAKASGIYDALIKDQVSSYAAKQMLKINIQKSAGGVGPADQLSTTLQTELRQMGLPEGSVGYPTTNIAVALGSITGRNFNYGAGSYFRFKANFGSEIQNVELYAQVMKESNDLAYPDMLPGCQNEACAGEPVYVRHSFTGKVKYRDISEFGYDTFTMSRGMPYSDSPTTWAEDVMPCSTLEITVDDMLTAIRDGIAEAGLGGRVDEMEIPQSSTCFIPTSSALDVAGSLSQSAFDIVYGNGDNKLHTNFPQGVLRRGGNGSFFEDDLLGYITDTYNSGQIWSNSLSSGGSSGSTNPSTCTWTLIGSNGGYNFTVTSYRASGGCGYQFKDVYRYYENGRWREEVDYS